MPSCDLNRSTELCIDVSISLAPSFMNNSPCDVSFLPTSFTLLPANHLMSPPKSVMTPPTPHMTAPNPISNRPLMNWIVFAIDCNIGTKTELIVAVIGNMITFTRSVTSFNIGDKVSNNASMIGSSAWNIGCMISIIEVATVVINSTICFNVFVMVLTIGFSIR